MSALNLTLHCGSNVVTREDIGKVVTPNGTETHRPVSHISLIERVEIAAAEFDIRATAYALNKSGDHMFALMQLALETDSETGLVIGVRNSHNKQFSAGIVAGNGVFVCDNLSFSGEMKLMRRHTKNIEDNLNNIVDKAILFAMGQKTEHEVRVNQYKDRKLSDDEVSALITVMYERGVLNISRAHHALREWIAPSYNDFLDNGPSVWRLYNAFTEAIKGASIWEVPNTTTAIHSVLDDIDTVLSGRLHLN